MGIGASITLLAIGAILAFAVETSVQGLDIAVIGIILMICGALGLVLTMLVFGRRERTGVAEERVITRDRDIY